MITELKEAALLDCYKHVEEEALINVITGTLVIKTCGEIDFTTITSLMIVLKGRCSGKPFFF